MTSIDQTPSGIRAEAADWFARLQDESADEAAWVRFTEWLEADVRHRIAYSAVTDVWVQIESETQVDPGPAPGPRLEPRRRRRWWPAASLSFAAGLALAVGLAYQVSPPKLYETPKGERRVVALADGSRIALNSGSKVAVRYRWGRRQAELLQGQADFDVVHNPSRPFRLIAQDRRIDVLGTEFDVLIARQGLTVTVLRGVVAVTPDNGGERVILTRGRQLHHGPDADKVSTVDEGEASAWRKGQLIYRDRRLADVAEDLSRYVPTPITVDPHLADYKVTAVLTISDEQTMVDRLEAILPVKAKAFPSEIRLEERRGS